MAVSKLPDSISSSSGSARNSANGAATSATSLASSAVAEPDSPEAANSPLHLDELARHHDPVNVAMGFGQEPPDDGDEGSYEAMRWGGETLERCKSWLTSMVVHLIVIIGLALLTMNGSVSRTISLELSADEYAATTDLDELQFDTSEWESLDEASAPDNEVSQELMEFQPDIEMLDDPDLADVDFGDPLASNANQLKRLSRRANQDELLTGSGASSFFGIETTGNSIVYIVDRSGSMQGQRWKDAIYELIKSVESLKPEQEFFIFLFSEGCHPMPQLAGRNQMVSASAENINHVKRWLARQNPDDGTRPLAAVRRAIKLQPDTVFLLTDGQFYDNTGSYLLRRAVLQQNVSDPDDLVINTIAFHCEVGLEMLMEIASMYNGTFRSVE